MVPAQAFMETVPVSSIQDILQQVRGKVRYKGWQFRGQPDSSWELIPKLGRREYVATGMRYENRMFSAWLRHAVEHFTDTPTLNRWDWLAIAQHHGLATRLLDWSTSVLSAAYFATESHTEKEGAIYCMRTGINFTRDYSKDPLETDGVVCFTPKTVTSRIGRQRGVFSLHGPPNTPMAWNEDNQLTKLTISPVYKGAIRYELSGLGIDRQSLFPDLDGLSQHYNWIATDWTRLDGEQQ